MCHIWLCFYDSKTMRCSSIYPGEYFVRFIKMKFNLSFHHLIFDICLSYFTVSSLKIHFNSVRQDKNVTCMVILNAKKRTEKKKFVETGQFIDLELIRCANESIRLLLTMNCYVLMLLFLFLLLFFCMATWSQCANSHVIDIKINTQYAITLECWQINRALQLLT